MEKKANIIMEVIIHLIIIGLLFGLFFGFSAANVNSRSVKQQILEKQVALMVDSAEPGMEFIVLKNNPGKYGGRVDKLEVREGKIFAYIDSAVASKGYPYFTKYSVSTEEDELNFYIKIR